MAWTSNCDSFSNQLSKTGFKPIFSVSFFTFFFSFLKFLYWERIKWNLTRNTSIFASWNWNKNLQECHVDDCTTVEIVCYMLKQDEPWTINLFPSHHPPISPQHLEETEPWLEDIRRRREHCSESRGKPRMHTLSPEIRAPSPLHSLGPGMLCSGGRPKHCPKEYCCC